MSDDFRFFDDEASDYFLPHIRCVGDIRKADPAGPVKDFCFVFRVYFSYNLDIELAFNNHRAAGAQRRELIGRIMDYWGPDQVVFSNGFDHDVTVVAAIDELTGIVEKDGHAGFAILVDGVPHPLHAVFTEPQEAQACLEALRRKLERHRRQKAAERFAASA